MPWVLKATSLTNEKPVYFSKASNVRKRWYHEIEKASIYKAPSELVNPPPSDLLFFKIRDPHWVEVIIKEKENE